MRLHQFFRTAVGDRDWLEEPLIRLYAWVQVNGCIDGEINYDMTADQARELAGSWSRAADHSPCMGIAKLPWDLG